MKRTVYHEWVFKASWHSTAVYLKVPGKDYADACKRVDSMIRRMEGGEWVKDVIMIRQLN